MMSIQVQGRIEWEQEYCNGRDYQLETVFEFAQLRSDAVTNLKSYRFPCGHQIPPFKDASQLPAATRGRNSRLHRLDSKQQSLMP